MIFGPERRHFLSIRSVCLALGVFAGILFLIIKAFFPGLGNPEKIEPAQPIEIKQESVTPDPVHSEESAGRSPSEAVYPKNILVGEEAGSAEQIPAPPVRTKEPRQPAKKESPEILVNKVQRALKENLSENEKIDAIRTLEDIDDPFVVEAVMIALADEEAEVRKAALDILKGLDDWAVNDALLVGLDDDDVDDTEKAMAVMDDISSPNILPSLEKALMDSDEKTQLKAVEMLEDIDDPEVVEILIERGLLNDNDDVFEAVLDSLEYITSLRFETYEQARTWWDANRNTFKFD